MQLVRVLENIRFSKADFEFYHSSLTRVSCIVNFILCVVHSEIFDKKLNYEAKRIILATMDRPTKRLFQGI